jgi:hypothetical protein
VESSKSLLVLFSQALRNRRRNQCCYAAVLRFSVVNRRIADAVLTAKILDRHAGIGFLQDADDLSETLERA